MSQKVFGFWVLVNGERFHYPYDEEVLIKIDNNHYKVESSSDNQVFYIDEETPIVVLPQCEEDE